MTEKKLHINPRNVHLPFPYPMLRSEGEADGSASKPVWPFREEGFVLINATLDAEAKEVLVKDEGAIFALNKMGFFGFNSNREVNQLYIFEQMIRGANRQQQRLQNQKQDVMAGEESLREERPNFKAGFYTLEEIDIPPACTKFEHDANRNELKAKEGTQRSSGGGDSTTTEAIYSLTSLKLCFEEAYFLSYAFGLMAITEEAVAGTAEQIYGLADLWRRFSQLYQPNDKNAFAARYAAYHFFRSKGWVVRNGFKFGTDYLLYSEGPPFSHALYSVMVRWQVEDDDSTTTAKSSKVHFQWNEVSGLTRVSKNAHKELLICMVSIPRALVDSEAVVSGPQCIRHFTVDCILVNRWNSRKGGEPFDHSQLFSS